MLFVCLFVGLLAQDQRADVRVEVRANDKPIAGATVVIAGAKYVTNEHGIPGAPGAPGKLEITIVKDGFVPATASGEAIAGEERTVTVHLVALEEEVTVI